MIWMEEDDVKAMLRLLALLVAITWLLSPLSH
jgi:hypothetical protein